MNVENRSSSDESMQPHGGLSNADVADSAHPAAPSSSRDSDLTSSNPKGARPQPDAIPVQVDASSLLALTAPEGFRTLPQPKLNGLDQFPLAKDHLATYPFRAPANVAECVAWYEGSFNPMHEGHAHIIERIYSMGFRTVVVGTVPRNPHKDPSTFFPFGVRVASVKEQLRDMGLPLAHSSREPGVFVTGCEDSFHDERLRAWYRDDWYVVMGPDNFQAYYAENRAWALFAAKDEEMKGFTRFQRLYDSFLAPRILVNDEEYDHHAEDIRKGDVKPPPAVSRVLRDARSEGLIHQEHLLRMLARILPDDA